MSTRLVGCLPTSSHRGILTSILLLYLSGKPPAGCLQDSLESIHKVLRLRLIGVHVLGHSACCWLLLSQPARAHLMRSPFLLPSVSWQRRKPFYTQFQYRQEGKWGGLVAERQNSDNWMVLKSKHRSVCCSGKLSYVISLIIASFPFPPSLFCGV